MKVPVVKRKDYIIYLEYVAEVEFVHCDIFNWSKTVKLDLLNTWEILCKLHGDPIYAYHYIGDTKHEKFLKITGFKHLKSGLSADLRPMAIYVKGDSSWE